MKLAQNFFFKLPVQAFNNLVGFRLRNFYRLADHGCCRLRRLADLPFEIVNVFGYDIDKAPEKAKAQIGLVGQEINFNPFEKPIDTVVNQGGYYGVPRSVALPRAKKLLEDLGLGEKMDKPGMTLSGGMKRRLMIARALIHKPRFLVLDEPTAGVDVELRRSMWEYLRGLTGEGVTILLTTHYLEEAEQLAKHVAIINKGQIVANGTMNEILALHDESAHAGGIRGGKLEEVFLQLTSEK